MLTTTLAALALSAAQAQAAPALAEAARDLGMIPSRDTAHLVQDAAGKGAQFNYGGYCNPKVDALAKEILVESDTKTRDDLIAPGSARQSLAAVRSQAEPGTQSPRSARSAPPRRFGEGVGGRGFHQNLTPQPPFPKGKGGSGGGTAPPSL